MKTELAQERDRVEREIAEWLRWVAAREKDEGGGVPVSGSVFALKLAERVERGDYRVLQTYDFGPDPPLLAVIKLRYEVLGGHVHAKVFVGPRPEELALSGNLVMTAREWQDFEGALLLGAPRVPWCGVVVLSEGRLPP
jgi:hypothetical protein